MIECLLSVRHFRWLLYNCEQSNDPVPHGTCVLTEKDREQI